MGGLQRGQPLRGADQLTGVRDVAVVGGGEGQELRGDVERTAREGERLVQKQATMAWYPYTSGEAGTTKRPCSIDQAAGRRRALRVRTNQVPAGSAKLTTMTPRNAMRDRSAEGSRKVYCIRTNLLNTTRPKVRRAVGRAVRRAARGDTGTA
ncbi:hypothetical protein Acsp01_32350 [Actinoplanes sp. NBRC 101535]|nr:hypothetical protein Acsp01_32350 [Actinoplanes sp. NBRC 101535]